MKVIAQTLTVPNIMICSLFMCFLGWVYTLYTHPKWMSPFSLPVEPFWFSSHFCYYPPGCFGSGFFNFWISPSVGVVWPWTCGVDRSGERQNGGRWALLWESLEGLAWTVCGWRRKAGRVGLRETFHTFWRSDWLDMVGACIWLMKRGVSQWVSEEEHIFRLWFAVNPQLQSH